MNARRYLHGIGLTLALSSGAALAAGDPPECTALRFAEIGWSDITATTGVASALGEALGYAPTTQLVSVPIAFTGVKTGSLDAFLGYWSPSMDSLVAPFRAEGSLRIAETANLEGAKYTLAVPAYAYDAGLKTFQDIARFKDQLGGRIYGIEPGNDGNLLIDEMIKQDQFGLGDFQMIESSEAGMLTQVRRAVRSEQWLVFLGWAPHPMNQSFDMRYLDGGDEVFGPDQGAAQVFTVTAPDYPQRCPNAARLLDNLRFDVPMEGELMASLEAREGTPEEIARQWIKAHPERLDAWLDGVTTREGGDARAAVLASLPQ